MGKRRGGGRTLTVEAVVFDAAGRVLLVRQGRRHRRWELPGGHVKRRESFAAACVREVAEETGLTVEPVRLVGLFFVRDERTHDAVLLCRVVSGELRPNPPEVTACEFVAVDRLPRHVRPFTADRIADAATGTVQLLPVELDAADWV